MNHKYISLIASVGGISILYLLSLLNQPLIIDIENAGNFEGKLVTTTGIVIDYSNGINNQLITIQHNNSTLLLFQESMTDVQIGDEIRATGIVQKYNDIFELIIDESGEISITNKWQENQIKLKEIAENPDYYLNQNVNVSGYVDVIFDEYFQLADEENYYMFLVKKPYIENLTLYSGKKVVLNAFFTYDPSQTRYIFEFRTDNHTIIPIIGD